MEKFTILKAEIDRRKTASLTLVVSLTIGFLLAFFYFQINFLTAIIYTISIGVFLILLRWFSLLPFKTHINSYVELSLQELIVSRPAIKINYSDITQINIIRTKRGHIREIVITLKNKREVFIDTLQDYERFKKMLLEKCPESKIVQVDEPIDYDHPMFYLVLGLLVGFVIPLFIKLLLNQPSLKIFFFGFTTYTVIIGL